MNINHVIYQFICTLWHTWVFSYSHVYDYIVAHIYIYMWFLHIYGFVESLITWHNPCVLHGASDVVSRHHRHFEMSLFPWTLFPIWSLDNSSRSLRVITLKESQPSFGQTPSRYARGIPRTRHRSLVGKGRRVQDLIPPPLVQDLIPPPSIYIHMCTLYTYTNTYMPRCSPSGFFRPSRCLVPTPELTTKYPICAACVCVCIYTHIHPHTLPPTSKIEKTQTTPLSLLLSKMSPYAKQQVPS